MDNHILQYYEKELTYIRQLGQQFSKSYPKIAANLGISDDTVEDPHISRLIESYAFLNSKIQYRLDDDFPEISDAFINTIYPHYLRPIPSMSIAQFNLDKENTDNIHTIEKNAYLDSMIFNGHSCRFKTVYETKLVPLTLSNAEITNRPFNTPGSNKFASAGAVLRLEFTTYNSKYTINELNMDSMRFYLKGQNQFIFPLYERLFSSCSGIVLATGDEDTSPITLNDKPQQVGFSDSEELLDYSDRSFIGYRHLSEYFIFPEKFMFFDINNINLQENEKYTDTLVIYIYFDQVDLEIERNISRDNLILNACPVINLFETQAEPIKLSHHESEHLLIPDIRHDDVMEINAIKSVFISNTDGNRKRIPEFYGITHNTSSEVFWSSRNEYKITNDKYSPNTKTWLAITDLAFNPETYSDDIITAEVSCTNHNLPSILPIGTTESDLACYDESGPISSINFLLRPTEPVYPDKGNLARWKLISHLNLNFLSLSGQSSVPALKELLKLYNFNGIRSTNEIIESLADLEIRQSTATVLIDGNSAVCNGLEITVLLDSVYLSGFCSYLFATVLEEFFTSYCPINSYVKIKTRIKGKEGYIKECKPRTGTKLIL